MTGVQTCALPILKDISLLFIVFAIIIVGFPLHSLALSKAERMMEVEPGASEAVQLAARLLKAGEENRWYSTQDNAVVLLYFCTSESNFGRFDK